MPIAPAWRCVAQRWSFSRLKTNCSRNTRHDKMKIDLADPIAVLIAASQTLEQAGLKVAAYGGLALAMYGEPRETKDADLAVAGLTGDQAETAFRNAGFDLIRAFDLVKFGGLLVTRLTLLGGIGKSLNTVDLVEPRSTEYALDVQARALSAKLREHSLQVVAPEDFVILKILATRERDLEDARAVINGLSGRLDVDLIERTLQQLSTEITDHECLSRWSVIRDS